MKNFIFLLIIILILIASCQPAEKEVSEMPKGNVLLIVAQKDFQPVEYKGTRTELEKAGYRVEVASITTEKAFGADGSTLSPDIAVKDVELNKYKAIVLIGGPGAPTLGQHSEVLGLIKEANDQGKIVAAICISPTILAKSGILEGKKATVWNEDGKQEDVLESARAEFVNEPVVQDGNIITANGPKAARAFGQRIAKALG